MHGRRKKSEKRGALRDSIVRPTPPGSAGPASPRRAGVPDPLHGPQPSWTRPISHSPPGSRLPLTCAGHSSNRRRPRAGPRAPMLPRRGEANLHGGLARSVALGSAQLGVTSSLRTRHSQTEGASASGDRLRAQVRKDGGVGSSSSEEEEVPPAARPGPVLKRDRCGARPGFATTTSWFSSSALLRPEAPGGPAWGRGLPDQGAAELLECGLGDDFWSRTKSVFFHALN